MRSSHRWKGTVSSTAFYYFTRNTYLAPAFMWYYKTNLIKLSSEYNYKEENRKFETNRTNNQLPGSSPISIVRWILIRIDNQTQLRLNLLWVRLPLLERDLISTLTPWAILHLISVPRSIGLTFTPKDYINLFKSLKNSIKYGCTPEEYRSYP